MSSSIIPVEAIVSGNFVKYNKLNELIGSAFAGSSATKINIFIDLYGVMKPMFSESFRTDISDYTAMTSTIINMCGHYRSYFKRIGVQTKIFLISSYNLNELNRKLVYYYNSTFATKSKVKNVREMVELNNELLNTLCPFLYDIFFLRTEYESSVLIDYLIRNYSGGIPNIIISKDIYPCQLTYLHPFTAYIKPKKLMGEDVSVIIPPIENIGYIDSFWNVYCTVRGGGNMYLKRSSIWIDPVNFTLLAAMTRFPERNFKTIMSLPASNKILFNMIGRERIKLSTGTVLSSPSLTNDDRKKFDSASIDARQKSLDIEFFRYTFDSSAESKLIKLENYNDSKTVRAICSEYFTQTPIDLERL